MATKKVGRATKKAASKKTSKKAALPKGSHGRAAGEKGKKFEDAVAELYRLLGAQVVQNIEIHQKKVDILATFRIPGSSREHTVIVECKDEKRAVDANQRVMAFKGLLDVARKDGIADSAEIVTRVSWSDQAKGFAKTSGVELFTYTEKISQLIDLSSYMKALISKFDKGDPARAAEPPLGSYYVDLSAQRGVGDKAERIPVIDSYVHQWLENPDSNQQLAIFGEFGSGKSTLCQKLAHDLALAHINDPASSRIPILLNLREFIGKLDLEAYITSFLDRECRVVNPRIELFRAMNEAGIFLMIFDGFDEMAVKVDADTLESNLIEIEKLAASAKSKTLLTSRPEYFVSIREESESLTPRVNPFLNRVAEYEPLKILPWSEEQVELFLQRRVPLVKGANEPWTYYRDQIKKIGSLSDLSQRPVLLDMIAKTLPSLIASGEVINLPNLYKNYLIGEMKRQKVLKKRSFLLSDDDRLNLLQDLALEIYDSPTQSLTFSDAEMRIEQDIRPPKQELEAHTRDFLTNSFLIRSGDEYVLSHKSILEYLVATKLSKEIQSDQPEIFGRLRIQYQVYAFLKELDPNPLTLLRWIETTREVGHGKGTRLGGNGASLLNTISPSFLAGKDLSGTNMAAADLRNADLRGCNLQKTVISQADLKSAKFYTGSVDAAIAANTVFSYYLWKTKESQRLGLDEYMFDAVRRIREHGIDYMSLGYTAKAHFREDMFWEMFIGVRDIRHMEAVRQGLAEALSTRVVLYYDECEQIAREADSQRTPK